MTGKRYYLTTFATWQRHATRCVEAHFIFLDGEAEDGMTPSTGQSVRTLPVRGRSSSDTAPGAKMILVLVTADESTHIALENDSDVEPLPHPIARTPVSERVAAALAPFGVAPRDDTFTAAEKLALVHPLLKHRVF